MNKIILFILTLSLASCSLQNDEQAKMLQGRIDALEEKQNDSYRPGLGEFMLGIQMHHAKLYFAGKNSNWQLADFELGEINETIEGIKKYANDRKEVKTIDMINKPLTNLDSAVKHQDVKEFETDFSLLTATCNSCHQTNGFAFNVIKVPDALPVSDQVFTPAK
jgi:hypothetical protein